MTYNTNSLVSYFYLFLDHLYFAYHEHVLEIITFGSISLQPTFDHHYNIRNRKLSHYIILSPSQLKGFPTVMYFINKVDIYPKHFISTGEKLFFTEKNVQMNHEDSAQKVHKKFFFIVRFMSVITLFFRFISLIFDYQ